MSEKLYSFEALKNIEIQLSERELLFEKKKNENSNYINIPFMVEIEGQKDVYYEIMFIPNDDLNLVNIIAREIIFFSKDILEYKEFHKILNDLNISTLFGNLFYTESSSDEIELVFSNSELIDDFSRISLLIDHMLNYIDFFIKEIYAQFDSYLEYKVDNE